MATETKEDNKTMLREEKREGKTCSENTSETGLSEWTALLTFCGFGSGLVTLPYAYYLLGPIFGVFVYCLIVIVCATFAYLLSVSYVTLSQRGDRKSSKVERTPYRDLMEAAEGKLGRYIFTVVLTVKLFATAVSFLALLESTICDIFQYIDNTGPIKVPPWTGSLALTICGGMGLLYRSPKSFKWMSSVAVATSYILGILVVTCLVYYQKNTNGKPSLTINKERKVVDAFTSIGITIFSLNFTFVLPTVQVDMVEPAKMKFTSVLNYIISGVCLGAAMLIGYYLSPGDVQPSLLDTFDRSSLYKGDTTFKVLVTLCQIILLVHLVTALCPVMNPLCQMVEETLNLPVEFTWHRFVSRFTIIILAFLLQALIPGFVHIFSINGGLFVIQLTITFPGIIYVELHKEIATWKKGVLWLTIIMAVVLSVCITVVGFMNIGKIS